MAKEINAQLQGLIKLISFFKQIRHKESLESLGFFFVNDLFNIIPYRQCILWSYHAGDVKLVAASGQMDIEQNSPLAQFVLKAVKRKLSDHPLSDNADARSSYIKENGFSHVSDLSVEECSTFSGRDVKEFLSPCMSHVFLLEDAGVIGGVLLAREKPLGKMERAVLEDAGDALAEKLLFLRNKANFFKPVGGIFTKVKLILAVAVLLFLLWPVKFSVTTYAEVVAKDSKVVTIPFDALIEDIHVDPNEEVSAEDSLFSLDNTRLKNEYALSKQFLDTAKERLSKTEREVFSDPTKVPELNLLREELKLTALKLSYAKERLDLSDVKAKVDGVVLFSDKNDLIGRPVKAGDVIMTIAKPDDVELLVRVPVDSMINLDWDIPVRFFLNTAPLTSLEAQLYNVSYKPSSDADGLMTYKARAKIADLEEIERIGLTGTAKLYGGQTVMVVNLLRRPFIAIRNLLRL